ncbi:MAG TPA: glycosyltransferase family 2 protein [Verrucomicrobiae bacterium]|nr:glycosyltransferase family 2 protein [Verrucomicrobiae bacterium]
MKLPTLSVVIPNYNHAHHLPRCLNALLNQSVQPHEIVVVDDASTDNSVEVIREFTRKHPCIKLLQNGQNQKVMHTTNRGIDAATGEFVYLQAADDEVLPGFLEKSLQLLAQHPQAGLSCTIGDWREYTGVHWHMGVGMTDRPAYLSPQDVVRLEQEGRFFIPGHSAIYRREALIKVGKLIPELSLYSDWFATTTLALRHGICVVPEPLAVFYIEPNTFFQNTRKDRQKNDGAIEHALRLLISPAFADVVDLFEQAGSLYICGEGTLRVLDQHQEFSRFRTARYLRKVKWHVRKVWLKKRAPAFLLNWYVRLAGYRARPTVTDG